MLDLWCIRVADGRICVEVPRFTCHFGNLDRTIWNIGPPIKKWETMDVYVIGLAKHGPAELSNFGSSHIGPPRVHLP